LNDCVKDSGSVAVLHQLKGSLPIYVKVRFDAHIFGQPYSWTFDLLLDGETLTLLYLLHLIFFPTTRKNNFGWPRKKIKHEIF